jgi:peptidoglycan LD-endopeptidase LytH
MIGIVAIGIGAAVKTGFIRIGRGGPGSSNEDSTAVTARTATGDVVLDTIRPPAGADDTMAVHPTSAELIELAAELIVPVAGVQPKDLLDTFNEPRGTRRHQALDIPAPRGTPVLAATDGRVQRLFSSEAGGLMVYASDPTNRFVLMYAHLDRYADGLADGMPLKRGETIGYVGTTGNAPPDVPHLHFAIARTSNVARWWTGLPVDPRPLLRP